MSENKNPGESLVICSVSDGVGDYRHSHCNSLVSASRVAHCGKGAASHTCVRSGCCQRHSIAEEVFTEHFAIVIEMDGIAYLQAILAGKAFLGKREIQGAGFKDEFNIFIGHR